MKAAPLSTCSLLLLLFQLSACGVDSSKAGLEVQNCEVAGSSYGIVGGKVLASGNQLSESTVMVIHDSGGDTQELCTGTLIDQDKVLTAAHCTSRNQNEHTFVAFSNNVGCVAQAPRRTVRVTSERVIHPDYDYESNSPYAATNDVAILKFHGKLPPGYAPRPLPEKTYDPSQALGLVFSGYGLTDDTSRAQTGTLRFTTGAISSLKKSFVFKRTQSTYTIDKALIVEQPEKGICRGDSGGPLYAQNSDGSLSLIGVSSMVADNNYEDPSKIRICHGVSIFVDVRAQRDWIQSSMEKLDRGAQ